MTRRLLAPECRTPVLAMASCAALALQAPLAPAAAQDATQEEDCVVAPGATPPKQPETDSSEPQTFSQTLTECGGVLNPAPVGDHQLVEPAPEAGTTPVIDPGNVPPQPGND